MIHPIIVADETQPFQLFDIGKEEVVDYYRYGQFTGVNTSNYKYDIKKPMDLADAAGEGIYPNNRVYQDPVYQKLLKDGQLEGGPWYFIQGPDYKKNFYKWATVPVSDGVKQFFTALALKEAGHFKQAIKAYYAAIVHFPGYSCWAKDGSFVWYIGPAAIGEIKNITRQHPELGLELEAASIIVKNGDDVDLSNDIVIVNPGRIVRFNPATRPLYKHKIGEQEIKNIRGKGKVRLVNYENGHWQMLVNGKPFMIKGLTYLPTAVGMSPDKISLNIWMTYDSNNNGIPDSPYETWVDINMNNNKDIDEPIIGDFQLLREMGCNTIRVFYDDKIDKQLLRDMYNNYGIYVVMCNLLGAYTVGSGANWEKGTDYTNNEQRQKMKESVEVMVKEYKGEPYILMWILGNENNLPADYAGINASRTNATRYQEEYAKYLNEIAEIIHNTDPDHPVAVGNAEIGLLDIYAQFAPQLDIVGINCYRGKDGFGILWEQVRDMFDRPMFLTEYGCDAYREGTGEDQDSQARYHKNCWEDILYNMAGGWGEGNSIGGCAFEWLDEWWKDNVSGDPTNNHQILPQADMNFPDGKSHEEWFGICSQGDGKNSPFLRQPRRAYYLYKEIWKQTHEIL